MAYLVFSWVKDMATIVTADVGEDLVTLTGNTVSIGHTEELVACGKWRHIVGVAGNISESIGHDDGGKR